MREIIEKLKSSRREQLVRNAEFAKAKAEAGAKCDADKLSDCVRLILKDHGLPPETSWTLADGNKFDDRIATKRITFDFPGHLPITLVMANWATVSGVGFAQWRSVDKATDGEWLPWCLEDDQAFPTLADALIAAEIGYDDEPAKAVPEK